MQVITALSRVKDYLGPGRCLHTYGECNPQNEPVFTAHIPAPSASASEYSDGGSIRDRGLFTRFVNAYCTRFNVHHDRLRLKPLDCDAYLQ